MDATPPKPQTDDPVVRNRRGSAKVFVIFRVAVHQIRCCFTDRTLPSNIDWTIFLYLILTYLLLIICLQKYLYIFPSRHYSWVPARCFLIKLLRDGTEFSENVKYFNFSIYYQTTLINSRRITNWKWITNMYP